MKSEEDAASEEAVMPEESPIPQPGENAPDVEAKTTQGETFRLADQRGKWVVLYFYPKAFTPG